MINDCWFLRCGICVCFPSFDLLVWSYLFSMVLVMVRFFRFPSSTFNGIGFVDRCCLHLGWACVPVCYMDVHNMCMVF